MSEQYETTLPFGSVHSDTTSKDTSPVTERHPLFEIGCGPTLCAEVCSKEFGAYLVVTIAAFLVVVYIISNIITSFIVFARDVGFPGQYAFITGTLLSFLTLNYVAFHIGTYYGSTMVLASYLYFLFAYIMWALNLTLSSEWHVRGARPSTNAGFFLVSAIIALLVIFYYSSYLSPEVALLMFVPLFWCMYMLQRWWFRYENTPKQKPGCADYRR